MGQSSSDLGGHDVVDALRKAVAEDNAAKLSTMLEKAGEELRARVLSGTVVFNEESGDSLLSFAVEKESTACVAALLREGASTVAASHRTGRTPFHVACSAYVDAGKRIECLQLLLHQMLSFYEQRARDEAETRRPPANTLHCLCDQDGDGKTVLMRAVACRSAPAANVLLQLKDIAVNESSPIAEEHRGTAQKDIDEVLGRLLSTTDFNGTPPLHVLVRECCIDGEEGVPWIELAGRCATANAACLYSTDTDGRTALHLASVLEDRGNCFKRLIRLGSPLLATNIEGRTLLHEVCARNYYRGARQLLSTKTLSSQDRLALVSARDARQRSTLLVALIGSNDLPDDSHPTPPDPMLIRLLVKYCPSIGDYRDCEGLCANACLQTLMRDAQGDEKRLAEYREVKRAMKKGRQHSPPEGPVAASSIQIQLCSDLHIEFGYDYSTVVEPSCKYLAMLGDIGLAKTESYRDFVHQQAERFEKVFVIAGNHEYYKSSVQEAGAKMAALCAEKDNVVFMDRTSVLLEGVRFLGCTLWSDIPDEHKKEVQARMSDYRRITVIESSEEDSEAGDEGKEDNAGLEREHERSLTVEDTIALHKGDVQWLKENISSAKEAGEPVVVLTHHSPVLHKGCGNPRAWLNPVVHGFGTDLLELLDDGVSLWAYGHTHWHHDMVIGSCRVLSNPRGYETESVRTASFSSRFCVSIPAP